ncbi:carbohydrate kinase [Arthrobacter sp. R1-13]
MSSQGNDHQAKLSDSKALVTVIGESLVDIIEDPRRGKAACETHPGGSPLNVAVGCARLGLQTQIVTHFADDAFGQLIAEHLENNGVETIVGGSQPTSTAVATLDDTGAARYTFAISWDINGASVPILAAAKSSMHVHTGSIATILPPGSTSVMGLIEEARHHATISFDPNCRPAISPDRAIARKQAEGFVASSDIVKASDEDLRWLYPDRTLEESMNAWLALGPALVALTRGADGPVLLSQSGRVDITGDKVAVADTVGAGDSFMATLISGLVQLNALGAAARERLHGITQDQLHALARYANEAAGITCSRPGADPPGLADLGPLAIPSSFLEA